MTTDGFNTDEGKEHHSVTHDIIGMGLRVKACWLPLLRRQLSFHSLRHRARRRLSHLTRAASLRASPTCARSSATKSGMKLRYAFCILKIAGRACKEEPCWKLRLDTMPDTKLHCPKCGDFLTEAADGSLECVRGRMGLAQELAERLRDCYVTKIREPKNPSRQHRIGGSWFCPGCGVAAQELTPGDVRCPVCSRSLAEFMFALIERHPHFDGVSGWR